MSSENLALAEVNETMFISTKIPSSKNIVILTIFVKIEDPKYYFCDIGAVEGDLGARLENAVAAHEFLADLRF
jgi:hypothetical protein